MSLEVFNKQTRLLRALAHPRRLEIVNLLVYKRLNVTDIYDMLDLPQANISQHLTKLKSAGVVAAKRRGKEIYYRLVDKKISRLLPRRLNLLKLTPLTHDPVCRMQLSTKTVVFKKRYQDKLYYFCASGCLKKFKKDPRRYL